jgi:hypothetical protein
VEVIEADGWEEIIGTAAVGGAVGGVWWLLPKAEAGVRSSRVGKVGVARRGSGQEGPSRNTCRRGSTHIAGGCPVVQIAISKCSSLLFPCRSHPPLFRSVERPWSKRCPVSIPNRETSPSEVCLVVDGDWRARGRHIGCTAQFGAIRGTGVCSLELFARHASFCESQISKYFVRGAPICKDPPTTGAYRPSHSSPPPNCSLVWGGRCPWCGQLASQAG